MHIDFSPVSSKEERTTVLTFCERYPFSVRGYLEKKEACYNKHTYQEKTEKKYFDSPEATESRERLLFFGIFL